MTPLHLLPASLAWTVFISAVSSAAVDTQQSYHPPKVAKRAYAANSPHGYEPQVGDCPSTAPSIRSADSLSDEETSWLQTRRQATIDPMRDLLSRMNIDGFDSDGYINSHQDNASALPNIGIALSGGGYRALLNGAGVLQAFDSRTPNSTETGHIGGLLQSATYIAGLSGGSWLVGSLYSNNFPSVNSILAQNTGDDSSDGLWEFGNSILEGPDSDIQIFSSIDYYGTLLDDVDNKREAGYNVSLTDYWGRALSFQLVSAPDGGPAYTFSSIADQDFFTSGSVPLPFIVADEREPGEVVVSSNTTVYHFSPWELGSEDPTLYAFAPLKYVGTNFTAGSPISEDSCTTGFDNVGYVIGTSSSLFNTFLTTVNGAEPNGQLSSLAQDAVAEVLSTIGDNNNDVAPWQPNPFYGYNNGTNPNAMHSQLTLVDGGEDLQNIPFHPLIQPNRHVDVIFAVDSSADTNASLPTSNSAQNWPDGAALVASYERSFSDIGNGTAFPSIPDINTFFNLGLNNRPVFFGCDASNTTGPTPLIVYLPNAPYVYNSNVSTFDLSLNDTERNAIVLNGYYLATQANATIDTDWPACVGCAILSRSFDRTGTDVPDACTQCFNRYCWDGTTDSSQPEDYVPDMKRAGHEVNVNLSAAGRLSSSTLLVLASTLLASMVLVW